MENPVSRWSWPPSWHRSWAEVKVHHGSHLSFPAPHKSCKTDLSPCCASQKRANLAEIRPQQRELHQTNLSFWLWWHRIIIHLQEETLLNLLSWFARLSCNDEDCLLYQHLYWIRDLTWIDPKWKQGGENLLDEADKMTLLPRLLSKSHSCIYLLSHITILLHLESKGKSRLTALKLLNFLKLVTMPYKTKTVTKSTQNPV